jgi:hypothetical protein
MLQYESSEQHWHVIAPPSSATSLLAAESFLQNGSAFGTTANLGTTDAYGMNFITSGATRFNLATTSATLTGSGATALTTNNSLTLSSGPASDISITSGTTGNLNLDTGTTGNINIGTNSNGKTINIGNTTPGSTVNIGADGGGINFNGDVAITGGHSFTTGSGLVIDNSNALSFSASNTIIDMSGLGTLGLNTTTNRPITTGLGLFTAAGGLAVNGTTSISGGLSSNGNVATPKGTDYSTTGIQNDVNFGAGALFRYNGVSTATFTGIAGGTDGREIRIINGSANSLTIANQSTSSLAQNRIFTGTGVDMILNPGTTISLQYDITSQVWRAIAIPSTLANISTLAFIRTGKTTFFINDEPLVKANENLVLVETQLINGVFYNVTAKDKFGNFVHSFTHPITITLPIPANLIGSKDLGVYWLNETNQQWVLIPDAVFSDTFVTFEIDHLTKFAIFKNPNEALEGQKTPAPSLSISTSTKTIEKETVNLIKSNIWSWLVVLITIILIIFFKVKLEKRK